MATAAGEHLVGALEHQRAVGQGGQDVVQRPEAELRLHGQQVAAGHELAHEHERPHEGCGADRDFQTDDYESDFETLAAFRAPALAAQTVIERT